MVNEPLLQQIEPEQVQVEIVPVGLVAEGEAVSNCLLSGDNSPELPTISVELADMRDRHALEKLIYRYPDINILVNNAGIQYNYEFADPAIAPEYITTELDINLLAPLYLTKLLLPQLLNHPTAAIINVTSGLGIVPKQSAPVYCASKAVFQEWAICVRNTIASLLHLSKQAFALWSPI